MGWYVTTLLLQVEQYLKRDAPGVTIPYQTA
jgi:hypothetical protein